ncbi:hypothetical protein FGO68_gene7327 [Halteria grandinella]|uniref:Uncharacterized protein n=1 Tax=Halteria grandinella TaxID=5974 RepID=A0A8J8SVM1_HALGN|nr:hypothetical protein FGO68_gene7327 [Halteria grandinella]
MKQPTRQQVALHPHCFSAASVVQDSSYFAWQSLMQVLFRQQSLPYALNSGLLWQFPSHHRLYQRGSRYLGGIAHIASPKPDKDTEGRYR